ncbi:MAG: ATP-binding protein [Gemmataceae bacterium]
MSRKVTVVLSQAPGKHPVKRGLEEALAAELLFENGVELAIVPNLYDLGPDHTGRMYLQAVRGDMVVLSWLYPRAAFWLLDRIAVKGHFGTTLLKPPTDEDDDEAPEADTPTEKPETLGAAGAIPDRHIYTLDLRDGTKPEPFLKEVRRIVAECQSRETNKPTPPVMVTLGLPTKPAAEDLTAPAARRWYPVIDYNRCTNCMECLDFCLFGVYDVDSLDRIIVQNQDQCKKGCPACSRVCPQQAIMFPEYKTASIAGADTGIVTGLKIDLSKLFGGEAVDPLAAAVAERDAELVNDGRTAVGMTVGIPKRQAGKPSGPKDELDQLVDGLDSFDL